MCHSLHGTSGFKVKDKDFQELSEFKGPEWFLARWGEDWPLIFFGSSRGHFSFLVLGFNRLSRNEGLAKSIRLSNSFSNDLPFTGGVMGIISYDEYSLSENKVPSLFFEVNDVLIFDHASRRLYRSRNPTRSEVQIDLHKVIYEHSPCDMLSPSYGLTLVPLESDDSYLKKVAAIQEDIRDGRFYQLNLLRFFQVMSPMRFPDLLKRFLKLGGPQSIWIRDLQAEIISFSPERFVRVFVQNGCLCLESEPIKGTIASDENLAVRQALARELMTSAKDLAELHMIVDLMRNDMFRVSHLGSLNVINSGKVKQFETIQHLVATIRSQLRLPMTLDDLFSNLCPGGSITGAPKVEVMKAICEYEQRGRGYFMGSAFYLGENGSSLDSNILIRTLFKEEGKWYYAAGSGLVIRSDASQEMREITTKCRILSQCLP